MNPRIPYASRDRLLFGLKRQFLPRRASAVSARLLSRAVDLFFSFIFPGKRMTNSETSRSHPRERQRRERSDEIAPSRVASRCQSSWKTIRREFSRVTANAVETQRKLRRICNGFRRMTEWRDGRGMLLRALREETVGSYYPRVKSLAMGPFVGQVARYVITGIRNRSVLNA